MLQKSMFLALNHPFLNDTLLCTIPPSQNDLASVSRRCLDKVGSPTTYSGQLLLTTQLNTYIVDLLFRQLFLHFFCNLKTYSFTSSYKKS